MRTDTSEQIVGVELFCDLGIDFADILSMLDNGLGMLRSLSTCTRLFSFFKFLLVKFEIVVLEIPLTEGVGINTYDGVLNEGLGTDEFIVCSVVNDIDHKQTIPLELPVRYKGSFG
jgi:hypothetical protein